jgi:transposase InsO family protein
VLAALADLFISRGPPAHIRSDNGAEFIANAVQQWLRQIGVKTLYIAPGSPWENGYNESQWCCATNCSMVKSSQPRRGQGADRSLAAALQHRPPAQQSWLSATGTQKR